MKRCPQCQAACWDAHRHCPACGADVADVEITDGDPLVGVTVGGKFVLREVVGEGAMGKVYRADQTNLGRTVAVKVMNPIFVSDEGLVRRFHDEARSASRLNHPNIVSVIDFGQTETGILYIVMEYLRGRTLARMVADEAPLPPARIVAVMGQVLDALEEAHVHGVVHRDLKPDNIMVETLRTGGDFAKVLDFGIAKLRREDRDFETIDGQCGTPEYMPPEQVRGQDDVDGRADLYSLGIVMYEMLTALTPFAGGSHAEVFAKQLNYAPKPPRQARPDVGISAAMEAIVLRALEKEREDRYASAAAMKDALVQGLEREAMARSGSFSAAALETAAPHKPEPEAQGVFPLPLVPRPEWRQVADRALGATFGSSMGIVAPDGSGKTMLVDYVEEAARASDHFCFRLGPDPTGSERAWYPIRQLCRELLDLRSKPTLESLEAALLRIELDRCNLAGLAGLFGVTSEFSALEYAGRRRECMASVLAAVRSVARRRPSIVIFEDVDRYDAASRDAVDRLLEDPGEGPLVVLATRARGTFGAPGSSIDSIDLGTFSEAEVRTLCSQAVGEAPPALIQSLMRATGGAPMHVEQILRYIVEGGAEPFLSLVDTIGARIARLPQEARTLLQTVALAGGQADDTLLTALGEDAGRDPVSLLEQRGFIYSAQGMIRIAHALFSDTAYEGTPEQARRGLHTRMSAALEGQHAEAPLVARHAYQARDRRAVGLLERAGERAQREFDDPGATHHYRRAVELQRWALLEGQPEAEESYVRLSVKLGEALFYTKDMLGAEGVLRETLGYAQGHPIHEARVRLALARLAIAQNQVERAERELRAGLRAGFKAGDASLLADLYLEFGGLYFRRGDLEAAVGELSEGVSLCTGGEGGAAEVGPETLWRLIARHAETLDQTGDLPGALAAARHALRHARRVSSLVGEARVHALLSQLYEANKDPKLAAQHREQALERMKRLGDRRSTAELLIAHVRAALKQGQLKRDGAQRLEEAAALAAQVGWLEGVERCAEVGRQSSIPPASARAAPPR